MNENSDIHCNDNLCQTFTPCTSIPILKPVYVQFGDEYHFEIPPETYMMDGIYFGVSGACVMGIAGASFLNEMAIMGDVFLRTYYTIYDMDNFKAGVAFNNYSNAEVITFFPTWAKVLIAFVVLAIVAAIIWFCYSRHKRR